MNMQDIYYAFPSAAYLLILTLPIAWMFSSLWRYRKTTLALFASPSLLLTLLNPRSRTFFAVKSMCVCLAWIAAVFALMEPHGFGKYPLELSLQPNEEKGQTLSVKHRQKAHEIIFLIDASASMSVKDTHSTVQRLDEAKEIADVIISRLRGENVSLYAFTSEIAQESPATMNYLFVRLMLRQISINEGGAEGTDFTKALESIRQKYFTEKTPWAKTLVILSDGGDTKTEALQGAQREKAINEMLNQLNDANKNNIRVFTIGIGSHAGAEIPNLLFDGKPVHSAMDEEILRKISQKGNGLFYNSNDLSTLDLAADFVKAMQRSVPSVESERTITIGAQDQDNLIRNRYFQFPLGLAILLLSISLVIPDTKRRVVNETTT